jgi:hypothetical protein
MRIVQNYKELARAQRLAVNSRLSYKYVLNNGSPTVQSAPLAYTPPPAPPAPANLLYTIAGDPLQTISGANLTTIS